MKKYLLALSGALLLASAGSVSFAAASSDGEKSQVSVPAASQEIAALQSEEESQVIPGQLPADPVAVDITLTDLTVEIHIDGKGAIIGDYNPDLQKRTIIIPQAALIGPPQKVYVDEGLINNIQVHEIHESDGRKVIIDIYALGDPYITMQDDGRSITVSISNLEDVEESAEEADDFEDSGSES